MLHLLFLLTDLLYGPAQVYSLEFGGMLGNFSLNLFKVHLEMEKVKQGEKRWEIPDIFTVLGGLFKNILHCGLM